jgi:hypothetical protein
MTRLIGGGCKRIRKGLSRPVLIGRGLAILIALARRISRFAAPGSVVKFLRSFQSQFSGDISEGETPVPIPNTAVKPLSADGTAL